MPCAGCCRAVQVNLENRDTCLLHTSLMQRGCHFWQQPAALQAPRGIMRSVHAVQNFPALA